MEKTNWAFVNYPNEWKEKVPGVYENTEENIPEECCYIVKSNQGLCRNSFAAKNDEGADTLFYVNVFGNNDYIWAHHLQQFADECPVIPSGYEPSYFDGMSFDVQSTTVNSEEAVSTIYEWAADNINDDDFSKEGKNVLLFVSGNISFLEFTELVGKIEGNEDFEIAPSLYHEDGNDSEVQVSLWWYDPIEKVKGLTEKWLLYCEEKKAYREKQKSVDMDDFANIVNRTWHYLSSNRIEAKTAMEGSQPDVAVMRRLFREGLAIIQLAENMATYAFDDVDNYKDNPLYSVTLFLADELARLAAGKEFGIPWYDYKGDFIGLSGSSMDLALLSTKLADNHRIYYDVDKMDYQDVLKAISEMK